MTTKYFKVTNENEFHGGIYLKEGLNCCVYESEVDNCNIFNKTNRANYSDSDCEDIPELTENYEETSDFINLKFFVFTTSEHINKFYFLGQNLRVIELPENDSELKVMNRCYYFNDKTANENNSFISNKIIVKEKYSLSDPLTYALFDLPYPLLSECIRNNYTQLIDLIMENIIINDDCQKSLNLFAAKGNLKMVKKLIDRGANINYNDDNYALVYSINNNNDEVIKYLINEGINYFISHIVHFERCFR